MAEARSDGTTTYNYNAGDRLTDRSGLGGGVTYAYDGNGRAGSRALVLA